MERGGSSVAGAPAAAPFPLLAGETILGSVFLSEVVGPDEQMLTMYLTSARLYLRDAERGGRAVPLAALAALQPAAGQGPMRLQLLARPAGRTLLLALHHPQDSANPLWQALARALAPARLSDLFAFASARAAGPCTAAWQIYRPEAELARQGAGRTWRLLPSPETDSGPGQFLALPAGVADAVPAAAAAQRVGGRVPRLAYYHALSRAALCRAAALRTAAPRSPADEELLRQLRPPTARLRVIDLRPATGAAPSEPQVRGTAAGYSDWYAGLDYEAVAVPTLPALAASLAALLQLPPGAPLRDLERTRWLDHVASLLAAATHAAAFVERGTSVLVQDPDGSDYALLLTVLTQVLLDPYVRTLDGLALLVEKELVCGGHKFATRCNPGNLRRGREAEQAPVALLLLDALYQLVTQRPTAFEWSPAVLAHIGEALYSAQYGSFLVDSVVERDQQRLSELTLSVWTPWFGKERAALLNPAYAPGSERLQIDPRVRALRLWPALRNALSSPSGELTAALPARLQQLDREVAAMQTKLAQLRSKQQQQPQRSETTSDSRIAELERERRELKAQCRAAYSKLEKLKEQRNEAREHNADLSALQQHLNARLATLQGTK